MPRSRTDLDWEFRPLTGEVQVHPGEQSAGIFPRGQPQSREAVTGRRLTMSLRPRAASISTSCNASASTSSIWRRAKASDMGVVFFVDPDMLKDPDTSDVRTITLSYTMFHAANASAEATPARQPAESFRKLIDRGPRHERDACGTAAHLGPEPHAAPARTPRQSIPITSSIRARGRSSARSRPGC